MVHITPGRRGALAAASAAVVCLGAFAALGPDCESNGAGYVAAGAPGPAGGPGVNAPPSGDVDLVPLDGRTASPSASGRTSPAAPDAPRAPDGPGGAGSSPPADAPQRPGGTGTPSGQGGTGPSETPSGGPTGRPAPGGSASSPSASAPGAPARLVVDAVERAAAADRWCEKVTVTLANTGDRAATAGTITFGTHVIGLLGVDWATVRSSRAAPVPVPGGGSAKGTWEVCVEAWRVPAGMHVETRDVSVADS
ncbi:hypothetical protein [Actinacidiphila glaucinigra]|uniref:Secreted protein n=1 Tax=Actinacidiphila glaucinigra TaxID=235986 RepID=A0A239HXK0_9ACTN|nr:hypothetical protein [Actinacidiphila glaucinigra]SNS85413.1 hypothetical protein SAMN05216252_109125 [Actinacidiphila glaucinigra]